MQGKRVPLILPERQVEEIDRIAGQEDKSRNELIKDACRMYCDAKAVSSPGSFLPQWAVQQIEGICAVLQTNLGNRSNQLLSSMAIQLTVIQMILADGLKIPPAAVSEYTLQAVEALKSNNRVFRMEEFLKG